MRALALPFAVAVSVVVSGSFALVACGSSGSDEGAAPPSPDGTSSSGGSSSGGSSSGGSSSGGSSSGDPDASVPEVPYAGPRAKVVVASDTRSCAIYDTGELRCWGSSVAKPAVLLPGKTITRVALGAKSGNACAIEATGALWCWTVATAGTPVEVAGGPWAEIAIGDDQFCGITKTGGLACWGNNASGQLGVGDNNPRTTPSPVGDATDWTKIAAGEKYTCGLRGAGALFCWGSSSDAGGGLQTNAPLAIDAASTFKDLAMYGPNRVVVRSDGAWLTGFALKNVQQGTDLDWTMARMGGSHRCARKASGKLICAGDNRRGQVGNGATEFAANSPVEVTGNATWDAVAAGASHTCAIRSDDGSVRCWGAATRGQLGDARPIGSRQAPSQVGATADWTSLDANQSRTCGTRKDGSVACWGQGLAVGADLVGSLDRHEPRVAIQGGSGWMAVDLGLYHYCVRKADGALACWGAVGEGQGGVGPVPNGGLLVTPAPASGLQAQDVSLGMQHSCAIDLAGKLWCWGLPTFNRLGFASASNVLVPTKVGDDTWTSVAATYSNTCATRSDGALFCFGYSFTGIERIGADVGWTVVATTPNDNEHFGLRSGVVHRWSGNGGSKVPSPVASASGWQTLAGSYLKQCGVKADGTIWCLNGQGATVAQQVGSDTDWKSVTVGYGHGCGLKTNGTAWCWGDNESGQIGDGTAWSPTPRLAAP